MPTDFSIGAGSNLADSSQQSLLSGNVTGDDMSHPNINVNSLIGCVSLFVLAGVLTSRVAAVSPGTHEADDLPLTIAPCAVNDACNVSAHAARQLSLRSGFCYYYYDHMMSLIKRHL